MPIHDDYYDDMRNEEEEYELRQNEQDLTDRHDPHDAELDKAIDDFNSFDPKRYLKERGFRTRASSATSEPPRPRSSRGPRRDMQGQSRAASAANANVPPRARGRSGFPSLLDALDPATRYLIYGIGCLAMVLVFSCCVITLLLINR